MKVNSTGLGKTTLVANFGVLEPVAGAVPTLKMTIESTQPIHWHISVALDGPDIRQFIGIVLKPKLILHVLKMLFSRVPQIAVETKPATPAAAAKSAASATSAPVTKVTGPATPTEAPKSSTTTAQTAANPKS